MSVKPEFPSIEEIKASPIPAFRYWSQKILPAVYDDSLSYYELLNKIAEYLNEVIETVNTQNDNIDQLYTSYQEVMNWIETYFENLDVSEEVNEQLDRYVLDGTMSQLISPFFAEYEEEIQNLQETFSSEIDEMAYTYSNQYEILSGRMDEFTRLEAGSTTGDAELADIRIGANGITYDTAGNAVRGQYTELANESLYIYNSLLVREPMFRTERTANRKLHNTTGATIYGEGCTVYAYEVHEEQLLFLNLSAMSTDAVYVFRDSSNTKVGNPVAGAVNNYVKVPQNAVKLFVAQPTDGTFGVYYTAAQNQENKSLIDKLQTDETQFVKGSFMLGSFLDGQDTTSLTRIKHVSPISYDYDTIITCKSGFKFYAVIYTTSSLTDYSYATSFISTGKLFMPKNTYFRLVICKNTEEAVTDFSIYAKAIIIYNKYKFDKNKKSNIREVCHQGYSFSPQDLHGHNIASTYANAAYVGFNYGETDVIFTLDNVCVCSHDATFTDLNTSNTIAIAEHTYAELITYNYFGGTISTLDEVMKTCKENGLGLYIDHLDYNFTDAQWAIIFGIVKKYRMQKRIFWLVTSSYVANKVKAFDEDANFSFVLVNDSGLDSAIAVCESLKTPTNIVSLDLYNTNFSYSDIIDISADLSNDVEIEVWVPDTVSEWKLYLPYVNGITSNFISSFIAGE